MSLNKIITTKMEVLELISYCKKTRYASIDFETSSLKYYDDREFPLCLGISFQPGSSWILPLQHKDSPLKDNWLESIRLIGREIIGNPDIIKIAWNLKFEYKWFLRYGILMKGFLFDGMLAKYCLDEEIPHDLKSFVDFMFIKYSGYEDEVKGKDWTQKPLDKLSKYCGIDCDLTLRSAIYFEQKLISLNFYNLFRNLLMMITRVLAESEFRGIKIDRTYLQNLIKEYNVKIKKTERKLNNLPSVKRFERLETQYRIDKLIEDIQTEIDIIEEADEANAQRLINNRELKIQRIRSGEFTAKEKYEGINFKSPPQMCAFLYSDRGLKLPIIEYTKDKDKKKTNTPSTAEDVLKRLNKRDKSGFIDTLLEYRGLTKLDSTYISGIYPQLDENDFIHASFKIHGTVTGRLSCENPNLQNIPRSTTAKDIKTMFIAPKGYVLFEVDYSQAELRIIAALSGDEAMIDIFNRNYNIHVATACKMNGGIEQYEKVKAILKDENHKKWLYWTKEKKRGKSLNFSIVYQQGPEATAEELECSIDEAKKFQDEWFKQFPRVRKWIENIKRKVHKDKSVTTLFGRKRRLYDIDSEFSGFRAKAERDAVNMNPQSVSNDFCLLSEIVIRDKILRGEFPSDMFQVYSVHDSIGYYIQPKNIHKVVPEVIKICDNPNTKKYFDFELPHVRMKVSPEVGINWASLSEYQSDMDYSKLLY